MQQLNVVPGITVGDHTYYDAAVIAQAFNIPEYHLKNAIKSEELKGRKIGKRYVVLSEDLKSWITKDETPSHPEPVASLIA